MEIGNPLKRHTVVPLRESVPGSEPPLPPPPLPTPNSNPFQPGLTPLPSRKIPSKVPA
jgi:hypothetical protein